MEHPAFLTLTLRVSLRIARHGREVRSTRWLGLSFSSFHQEVFYHDIVFSVDADPARYLVFLLRSANVEDSSEFPSTFPYIKDCVVRDLNHAALKKAGGKQEPVFFKHYVSLDCCLSDCEKSDE